MRMCYWCSDVCSSDLVAGFQYRCATDTEHIFLPRRIPAAPRKGYLIRARLTEPGGDCIGYVIGFAYEPMIAHLAVCAQNLRLCVADRKSVVWGKGVSVRVGLGGCRFIKKKTKN